MFGTISQTFGRAFLTANVLPAGLLTGSVVLAMKAGLLKKGWAAYSAAFDVDRSVFVLIVILFVAVLFSLFSREITRIYEGYSETLFAWLGVCALIMPFGIAWFARHQVGGKWPIESLLFVIGGVSIVMYGLHHVGRRHHRNMFRAVRSRMDADKQERQIREYKFVRAYPQSESLVLPTAFGNVLRAFEHYPRYMFGMDPITMWFRLIAIVPDPLRMQLETAESTTQFFLNLSAVSVAWAGGAVYIAIRMQWPWMLWCTVAFVILSYGLYRLACRAATQWGESVRTAFDLYRFELMKQLSIKIDDPQPWSLEVERKIWARVQGVTFYAREDARAAFAPALQNEPKSPSPTSEKASTPKPPQVEEREDAMN